MNPDHIISLPEQRAGIYHLIRDGRVLYVGQSVNLISRIGNHEWTGFDEVRLFYCPPGELDRLEEQHIAELQPPMNAEGVTRPYRSPTCREFPTRPRLINSIDRLRRARREIREIRGEAA